MYRLYIANKNYSSWSLRPWILLKQLAIPFSEQLLPFGDPAAWQRLRELSPAGKVPVLAAGDELIWDSLAITEWLAERHAVWPSAGSARSWARSAAAEMHSSFTALRQCCAMNCGVRVRLTTHPPALGADLARLAALWGEGLQRFGGPFLAGATFSAADAFYAPVAFRVQSYGLALPAAASAYVERLLALPAMREWYAAALAEPWRDAPHEADLQAAGELIADLRQKPAPRGPMP